MESISSLEYQVLRRIKIGEEGIEQKLSEEERAVVRSLLSDRLLRVSRSGRWYLDDKAEVLLLRFQENLDKESKKQAAEKAERHSEEKSANERWRKDATRSWIQFWLNALFSVLGFGAGVFVEHYFAILEMLLSFF